MGTQTQKKNKMQSEVHYYEKGLVLYKWQKRYAILKKPDSDNSQMVLTITKTKKGKVIKKFLITPNVIIHIKKEGANDNKKYKMEIKGKKLNCSMYVKKIKLKNEWE